MYCGCIGLLATVTSIIKINKLKSTITSVTTKTYPFLRLVIDHKNKVTDYRIWNSCQEINFLRVERNFFIWILFVYVVWAQQVPHESWWQTEESDERLESEESWIS